MVLGLAIYSTVAGYLNAPEHHRTLGSVVSLEPGVARCSHSNTREAVRFYHMLSGTSVFPLRHNQKAHKKSSVRQTIQEDRFAELIE